MSHSIILHIIITIAIVSQIVYEIIFWIKHKRPLTDDEIKRLSEARRVAYINETFKFTHNFVGVNKEYRSSLNREGRWDPIDIDLYKLPSMISQLLRYKRHEWFIWCLANDRKVRFIWANKGDDNKSCYSKITTQYVIRMALSKNCTNVICMHNHPHTKERTWNLLLPSTTDQRSYEKARAIFNDSGINIIEAVCSQGSFSIYGYSFSTKYYPKCSDISEIIKENGVSESQNYKLHMELRRNKWKRIHIN